MQEKQQAVAQLSRPSALRRQLQGDKVHRSQQQQQQKLLREAQEVAAAAQKLGGDAAAAGREAAQQLRGQVSGGQLSGSHGGSVSTTPTASVDDIR